MKRWYSFYNERITNRQRSIDENRQQPADELEMPELFGEIPWFHHVEIISKSRSLDEALFHINEVIVGNIAVKQK